MAKHKFLIGVSDDRGVECESEDANQAAARIVREATER
jgi:hypothetical protein